MRLEDAHAATYQLLTRTHNSVDGLKNSRLFSKWCQMSMQSRHKGFQPKEAKKECFDHIIYQFISASAMLFFFFKGTKVE